MFSWFDFEKIQTVYNSIIHCSKKTEMDDTDVVKIASCCCGQFKVNCTGSPVRSAICHCFACQQRTGSVFGFQARYLSTQVMPEGNSRQYKRIGDSGNEINFFFCPDCGSTLYWELQAAPGFRIVAIGNFMDPKFTSPEFSVYESRCHSWVSVPENIVHYD